ncbi:LytTR family DNA-binding domain-containing protein, partial [Kribbia dieselivorans]|uniref:LytTR family DNA-binding domain-containing protein n=1 Tax=Kribbia dieselivorans TaxID=331526 RepID=UPI000B20E4EE
VAAVATNGAPSAGGTDGGSRAERVPAGQVDPAAPSSAVPGTADETVPVELGGVTRFINRSDIRFVQAHGDYARLHTSSGSHLIRVPLVTLEERWAASGFVRIHRSTLVSTQHITEVRMEHGRCTVVVDDGRELQVSRRHTRQLKDRMMTGPSGWRADG